MDEDMVNITKGWTLRKTIDLPTVLMVGAFIVAGLFGWWDMQRDMDDFVDELAQVSLGYKAADVQIAELHQTQFVKLDAEIDEVKSNMSAQAVSLGRIEAGQDYIQRTLEVLVEGLE